jgi:glycosyltransferase involved in cell wall biosynthesis
VNIIHISAGELRIPVEKGGGIEGYILMLARSMAKLGHTITVLDRKYSPDDPDIDIDDVNVARLKTMRFTGLNYNIRLVVNQIFFATQVNKYLTKVDFDIVHVHNSVVGLFLSVINRNLRKKLFYTSHTTRRTKESVTTLSVMEKVALMLENQLIKRARKIIALNELVREKLISDAKVRPENVVMLPVIIDTDRFSPALNVGDVRQKYGLDKKFVVLFVGRLRADKGVEYLIKSANIVVNYLGCSNAFFLLVGPTEEFGSDNSVRSAYLNKVTELIMAYRLEQNIKLAGPLPLDDLRKLYAACDVFVLPSLTEAMPTAILEAMASGKAVIGTKVGGIPLQIKDNQNGLLIDPANEKQLAEAIKYMIDNPAQVKKMGTCGRKAAEEEFSSDKIAPRLLQVYQDEDV